MKNYKLKQTICFLSGCPFNESPNKLLKKIYT